MKTFWKFFPFWLFLLFFKFAASLHYTLLSPFGERLLPLWIVGLLIGAGSFVQLVLDIPAGYLLDKYGFRLFLKITTVLFFCVGVCLLYGLTVTTFVLNILISTFGWLFFNPGIDAYTLSHAPKKDSGRFISLRDVFCSIGVVLASAVLPFTLAMTTKNVGLFLCGLFFVAFLVLSFSPTDVPRRTKTMNVPKHIHRFSTLKILKKLNPASTMLLLLGLSGSIFYGVVWFVVPIIIVHQVNAGLLSLGLGVFDFAIVILGFFLGTVADKFNKRVLVFCGLLLFSLSAILIGFHFDWLFLLLGFLATTGDEMAGISLWAWLHNLDREHTHDGTVAGAISLFHDLGWTIGPIAAGILYTLVGPSWSIVLGAIPIFCTWILYQFFIHQHSHPHIPFAELPRRPHHRRSKS